MSNSDPGEEGLCTNCGVFGPIYDGQYCEQCFESELQKINDADSDEGTGIRFEPNICSNKSFGNAINQVIPFDYQGDAQICPICFENVVEGNVAIALPCAHTFHASCIYSWLTLNEKCPVCRSKIYVSA